MTRCLIKQEMHVHGQPPIHWVRGALSLWVKWPCYEAHHSPPSSAEVKNAWNYTSIPPLRLDGVVLNWNTGTTLIFTLFAVIM